MVAAYKVLNIGFTENDVRNKDIRNLEVFESFFNRSKANNFGSTLLEER
jgi:hypothetical protein